MAEVRYWVAWTCNQTNDKHNTDLYDTQEDAMKAVPWRAYPESVVVYATYAEPMEYEVEGQDDA